MGASWNRHRSADFHVCCVAGFQTGKLRDSQRLADLEVGDTAGLETCATSRRRWSNGGSVKDAPGENYLIEIFLHRRQPLLILTQTDVFVISIVSGRQYFTMLWFQKNKEAERYYLLPGMGGRAVWQKQKMMLQWAIITGLFVSIVFAIAMYYFNLPPWK
jgi:hypothetical protein